MTRSTKKTIGLISLGCPKNTVDSERILGDLVNRGWVISDDFNSVGCLIVNTCGFISDAVLESVEVLSEVCQVKSNHPDMIVVITGCLPQREGVNLAEIYPEADLVVGVGDLDKLPDLIESLWNNQTVPVKSFATPGHAVLSNSDSPRLMLTPPWTAYMKISEGCNHKCSFCTIPSIKGPHISRPVDDIVKEAVRLESEGVKELIIISQDTTGYGVDIGTNLTTLLSELDAALGKGVRWVRLHYLYPGKVNNSLLDLIAESKHIIPYFDIPLQHTQPEILKRMNRLAPETDTLDMIKRIRSRFETSQTPACIRSTIIVGFPGETESDIQAVYDFIQSAKIDRLTAFKFSPEDGTPAEKLPDQVDDEVAIQRLDNLMEIQREISLEINETWIGKNMDVMLEGVADGGYRIGRSYRDAGEIDGFVIISGVPDEVGDGSFINVKITGALEHDLEGKFENLSAVG